MSVQSEINRINSAKDEIRSAIEDKGVPVPAGAGLDTFAEAVRKINMTLFAPIGYIFAWAPYSGGPDLSTPEKVAEYMGFGTWAAYSAGRVLVGIDASQGEFSRVGNTGGEKTHQLSVSEMPSHSHRGVSTDGEVNVVADTGQMTTDFGLSFESTTSPRYIASASRLSDVGGGNAHNNLQPYTVVYYWQRIA